MNEKKTIRSRWLHVRVSDSEYDKIYSLFKMTVSRKLSDYIRKTILQKPVVVKYRNESADAFLADMIKLKNELSAIGNNYNQAVHRLHTLDRVPEIKAWLIANESLKLSIIKKVEEIKERMDKMYHQWLQI